MGSWSETCAISNLPITYQDEVVYLLITEKGADRGNGVYYNDYFMFRSVPLFSTYEDCGAVKEGSDEHEDSVLETMRVQFANDLIEKELGENQCHDHEVKLKDFNLENLGNWLHGGRVSVKGFRGDDTVRKIMILRSVWDVMVNTRIDRDFGPDSTIEGYRSSMVDFLSAYRSARIKLPRLPIRYSYEGERTLSSDLLMSHGQFWGYGESPGDVLERELRKEEGKENAMAIDRICQLAMVTDVMRATRMAVQPTVGAGCQHEDYRTTAEMHERFGAIARAKHDEEVKRRAEWDAGEAEWEKEYEAEQVAKENEDV